MARIPAGADLIANSVSIAPGFRIGNVVVMAGVPSIMESMLQDATSHLETGAPVQSASLSLFRPEAEIADLFRAHQKAHPDVIMGSYPHFEDGRYRTELVLRSTDADRLRTVIGELEKTLKNQGFM
jgi:molybdopterin-biosynthesis enzyme MoeA-like protein